MRFEGDGDDPHLYSLMKESRNATRCSRLKKVREIVGIELSVCTEWASVRVGIHRMVYSKTLHQIATCYPSSSLSLHLQHKMKL